MIRIVPSVLLGITLALVLTTGSLTHALIPHTHSDHHSPGEGAMWQSLHSSLRHEDKQALPVFTVFGVLGAVVILTRFSVAKRASVIVHSEFELLRRGIAPHRKFG